MLIETRLAGARMRLQLDIGVADVAVPEPGWVDYPTLLDMDAPHILAYQPQTAIAEKFETMISKGLLNSRVKDYYDVWMLSRSVFFDGSDLTEGIAATFGRRGTDISDSEDGTQGVALAGLCAKHRNALAGPGIVRSARHDLLPDLAPDVHRATA